jgi:putative ABC transport system permease protein
MHGAMVNSGLFPALGARPAIGRWFAEEDDLENGPGVLILSHSFWKNQFGGDEEILGQSVVVDDRPHTVVGVMPEDFSFPTPTTQFWESLAYASRQPNRFYLRPVGRLKTGVTKSVAQEQIAGTEWVIPAHGDIPERIVPLQAMSLLSYTFRDAASTLLLFQGAAFAVLLIACLNVTSLLLVRAKARESEIALRAALGAARSRLARLTLTETGLLGLLGGAIGLFAAGGLVRVALSSIPGGIPLQERVGVGAPVIVAGLLLALIAGTAIGLLPAIRTTRIDLGRGIGNTGKGMPAGKSTAKIWNVLVSAQLAVAVILLIGGGLLLESFAKLRDVDPGFDAKRVLIANVPISRASYPDQADRVAFYDEFTRRLKGLPQIRGAAVMAQAPFTGWSDGWSQVESASGVPEDVGYTESQMVGPGYFETLGIPLMAGRDFDDNDAMDNALVAIVNETLASRQFPGSSALGRRIRTGRDAGNPWMTIVGVVGDIKHISLESPDNPQLYTPYSVASGAFRMPVAIRAEGDPLLVVGAVRETVAAIDPSIPPPATYSLQSDMQRTMADERFNTGILASFAATALLLAMLGVYSVVAQTVTMRSREFGIRKALGATEGRVVLEVVARSAAVIVVGLGVGLAAAFALAGVMESFLFGVQARDPVLFVLVAAALGIAAMAASFLPAHRAGLLDPVETIRAE